MVIYPAESNTNPTIEPNPETGIVEHDGFIWVSKDIISRDAFDYLRPHILSCIESYFK